jgi:uncharacterized protein
MALFGSALRDDSGPDSDIDVLVEFEPGHVPGPKFVSMSANSRACSVDAAWTWSRRSS